MSYSYPPGTRSWSQYDVRALYHTYDIAGALVAGKNTFGVQVGHGWYSKKGFGSPTVRMVARVWSGDAASPKLSVFTTNATDGWQAAVHVELQDRLQLPADSALAPLVLLASFKARVANRHATRAPPDVSWRIA